MVDEHTVTVIGKEVDPDLLFLLGQATAAIVEPTSAEGNGVRPVGTGPYQFTAWSQGASVTLSAWDGYRTPGTPGVSARSAPVSRRVSPGEPGAASPLAIPPGMPAGRPAWARGRSTRAGLTAGGRAP